MRNNYFIFLFAVLLFSCQKFELKFFSAPVINVFNSENAEASIKDFNIHYGFSWDINNFCCKGNIMMMHLNGHTFKF